jgi:hypothetical protein
VSQCACARKAADFQARNSITGIHEIGNRAEETWLVCQTCNARLNNTDFKASVRSAFESYQLALRRLLQTHQTRQTSLTEPQSAA